MTSCSRLMMTGFCESTVSFRSTGRPQRSEDRIAGCVVATIFLCATLFGCVMLPVPVPTSAAPNPASRTNVREGVEAQIVKGQTTRTRVLLTLGEPDYRSADDTWFEYSAVARRGGLHWGLLTVPVVAGSGDAERLGTWDTAKRLTIRFDEQGLVSAVSVAQYACNSSRGSC
jgi:hypothetical protein